MFLFVFKKFFLKIVLKNINQINMYLKHFHSKSSTPFLFHKNKKNQSISPNKHVLKATDDGSVPSTHTGSIATHYELGKLLVIFYHYLFNQVDFYLLFGL